MGNLNKQKSWKSYLKIIVFATICIMPLIPYVYFDFILTPDDYLKKSHNLCDKENPELRPLIDETFEALFSGRYKSILDDICRSTPKSNCSQFATALFDAREFLRSFNIIDNGKTTSFDLGFNQENIHDFHRVKIQREYKANNIEYGTGFVLLSLEFVKTNKNLWILTHFDTKYSPNSVIEGYKLPFETLKTIDILFLIGLVVIPMLVLYAVYLCLFKTNFKLKWLWILFILIGYGNISNNISTHQILLSANNLDVLLYGSSYESTNLYGPGIVTISFPIGALVFIIIYAYTRTRLRANHRLS